MDDMKPISVEDAFAVFSTEPKDEVETQEMTKADAEKVIEDE